MKKTLYFLLLMSFLVGATLGCRSKGGKTTTDWSLPSVALPSAKKGDPIAKPSEKANPKATAELAHQRANGTGDAVGIGYDDSLRPNAEEVAHLGRFEGNELPPWTESPSPSAGASSPMSPIGVEVPPGGIPNSPSIPPAPAPYGSIAQNPTGGTATIPPLMGSSTQPSVGGNATPQLEAYGTQAALPPSLPESLPATLPNELPSDLPNGLPNNLPGSGVASQNVGVNPNVSPNEVPNGGNTPYAPDVPNAISPNASQTQQAAGTPAPAAGYSPLGSSMSELPAVAPEAAQELTPPRPLFLPGNINPTYPGAPGS
ncbi:MAG: hypothetical protein Q4D38_01155 [Planctomycetia bacterium]|nr:hypothetical protein [Planctomycetia bacterium]